MKFLYVSRSGLPSTAPGIRIYNIALLLRDLGHEVVILCEQKNDISSELTCEYDNFVYLFDDHRVRSKLLSIFLRAQDILFANRSFRRVIEEIDENDYDGIFLYNDALPLTKKLLKIKKDYGFKMYSDVTEWYELFRGRSILGILLAHLTNIRITRYDSSMDGIIVISQYLYDYLVEKNTNTIIIPPVFWDIPPINMSISKSEMLVLVYAGSPGSKDLLEPIIEAVKRINTARVLIEFNIIGLDSNYLKKIYGTEISKHNIYAYGRLTNEVVKEIIKKSDLSVLLRKPLRYAKAGFSTKFAESMILGVPVLCNRVGGADIHIVDGYNGYKIV